MNILIIWVIFHAFRVGELFARHHRCLEQQKQERFEPEWLKPLTPLTPLTPSTDRSSSETAETAELLNHRWTWTGNTEGLLRFIFESLPEQRKRIAAAVASADSEELDPSWIRVPTRSTCSCVSQNVLLDLGNGHYPRYLPTSRCKSKTCQGKFHSCKLIDYTVYVLRLRDANDNITDTTLPESLRHKWLMKPISVAVACISTSDNRRN